MTIDAKLIEGFNVFRELDADELKKVAELMSPMSVTEGEILTQKDKPARTFYVVIKGNFMIEFEGERAFTIHEPGTVMGWSTLVTPFTYKGTAVALTDGEVVEMPGNRFYELIQSDSGLCDKVMKRINRIIEERMPFMKGELTGSEQKLTE